MGGRRPPRPVVPAVPRRTPPTPAGAYRIDRVRVVEVLADPFTPPADLDPVARARGAPRRRLGVRRRGRHRRAARRRRGRVPAAHARPARAGRRGRPRRLVGSTSNPLWYAEQLAAVPAPYRIVGGPELREAAPPLGRRAARRRHRRLGMTRGTSEGPRSVRNAAPRHCGGAVLQVISPEVSRSCRCTAPWAMTSPVALNTATGFKVNGDVTRLSTPETTVPFAPVGVTVTVTVPVAPGAMMFAGVSRNRAAERPRSGTGHRWSSW